MALTLACGPYFDQQGLVASLVTLFFITPFAYFAFIQAFRYRVATPLPMTSGRAAKLALVRVILSLVIIIPVAGFFVATEQQASLASWIVLGVERVVCWWFLGSLGAKLRGRRLFGWTISGAIINLALDLGLAAGLFAGVIGPVIAVAAIALFIAGLHIVGRRKSLRLRFAIGACRACGYDMTGNQTGTCPECGAVCDVLHAT